MVQPGMGPREWGTQGCPHPGTSTHNVRVAFILTTVAFARFYKRKSGCTRGSRHPLWDTGAVPTAPPNRGPGTGGAPTSGLSLPHFPSVATFSALWGPGVKPTLPRRLALSNRPGYSTQALLIRASFLKGADGYLWFPVCTDPGTTFESKKSCPESLAPSAGLMCQPVYIQSVYTWSVYTSIWVSISSSPSAWPHW